jgi:hypothetical protein
MSNNTTAEANSNISEPQGLRVIRIILSVAIMLLGKYVCLYISRVYTYAM